MSDKSRKDYEAELGPKAIEVKYKFIREDGYVLYGPNNDLYLVTSIDNQKKTLKAKRVISGTGSKHPLVEASEDPSTPTKTFRFDEVKDPAGKKKK